MRHIISRNLTPAHNGNYEGLEQPHLPLRPQVGLIIYEGDDLEYIVKQEIAMLKNLVQKNQILLHHLRALDDDKHFEELEYLKDFLYEKDLQVIHLACHACEQKTSSKSYLLISNDFPITMRDLAIHEFQIKNYPLVILNACLTGTIDPLSAIANWAILFSEIGARGVLATEFHVPDWFAAAFIEELYKHLLSGKQIGEALLTTRRHFWDFSANQGKPLGMAYAFYGSSSLRIADWQQSAVQGVPITNMGG